MAKDTAKYSSGNHGMDWLDEGVRLGKISPERRDEMIRMREATLEREAQRFGEYDKRLPTPEETQEVIDFLPRLYEDGFEPETEFRGSLNSPDYDRLIGEFVDVLGQPQWDDQRYMRRWHRMRELRGPDAIKNASLREMKTLFTHFKRGENFSGGWWAGRINDGHVKRLLERLIILNGGA